jgi:hypothetical protein
MRQAPQLPPRLLCMQAGQRGLYARIGGNPPVCAQATGVLCWLPIGPSVSQQRTPAEAAIVKWIIVLQVIPAPQNTRQAALLRQHCNCLVCPANWQAPSLAQDAGHVGKQRLPRSRSNHQQSWLMAHIAGAATCKSPERRTLLGLHCRYTLQCLMHTRQCLRASLWLLYVG